MKLKTISAFACVFTVLFLSSCSEPEIEQHYTFPWIIDSSGIGVVQNVNPLIGTDGHGHTFPGATAPFGMVQLSPDTRIDGSWDGCSGYHYSDTMIYGFSHTHLSGTGCSDYGDIMLMPGHGTKRFTNGSDGKPGYPSGFSHENEKAEAGYYSVVLNNNITCELTASPRVGVHRYQFVNGDSAWVVLDMAHRDEVLECELEIIDDRTIRGKRFSKAWATNQQLWFYAEFSEPFAATFWSEGITFSADSSSAKDLKAVFNFGMISPKTLEVKVALSPVSWENAKMNLDAETGNNDFDFVRNKCVQNWDNELSKIQIEETNQKKRSIFYTALYHCFIAPNVYCDVNGEYRGMDHAVYRDTVHQRYSVFSLWDTYRALHPLFTVVQQKRTNDFINTFLQQYKESGRLPVWELSSNETDCMIGYHSVSVIADAWMKGLTQYDTSLALDAMIASAMENRSGLENYRRCGYIPSEGESESVSKTLEYAYDDWCISRCAERSGKPKAAAYFKRRSNNWKNLYNPETGFLQARVNNAFVTPFTPSEVNFHYTEANAWQYSLAVQHDPIGLIRIHGGPEQLSKHMDALFNASTETSGRDQADITGLIGQYAHGNEPSHHMAYLYSVLHEDWKTQSLVHEICNHLYTDRPDGLCGNEDCGQMSAWYVLSAAGFYPITPGLPEFTIGSPQFKSVKFHLENGKTFTILADGVGDDAPYTILTGPSLVKGQTPSFTLQYASIMEGATLQVTKSATRPAVTNNTTFVYIEPETVVTPWITDVKSLTFIDEMRISMATLDRTNDIYYSLNNGTWTKWVHPISISENSSIRMYGFGNGERSDTATANFYKAPAWKSISIRNPFAPQYAAGGDRALIDGMTGTTNFRTGLWQGYEGTDIDVVIDLGASRVIDSVYIGFLTDENAWIFGPRNVTIEAADDLSQFSPTTPGKMMWIAPGGQLPYAHVNRIGIAPGTRGRYLHVVAAGEHTCPKGHPGEGKPAWLFADEITIKTK